MFLLPENMTGEQQAQGLAVFTQEAVQPAALGDHGEVTSVGQVKGHKKAEGLGSLLEGLSPEGCGKWQERETLSHSAVWKVENGHEEEEVSPQGSC